MDLKIMEFYDDVCYNYYYNKQKYYNYPPIVDYYNSRDQRFIELLELSVPDREIGNIINLSIRQKNIENRKKFPQFPYPIPSEEYIDVDGDILDQIYEKYKHMFGDIKNLTINHQKMYIYLYFYFDIFYLKYKNRIIYNQSKIKKCYDGIICDKNYETWNLIPIDEDRKLYSKYIVDYKNNKTIYLSLDDRIISVFNELINDGSIKKISLRSNDLVFDGRPNDGLLKEEFEKGEVFSVNINGLPKETKLYSTNYNNQMWVFRDGNDLTFEELIDDFEVDDDSIVTQMVHLQFVVENETPYITHIDKENIFYTLEEYEERCRKNTKGTAKKRIKFFKIDDSKIRFDYMCNFTTTVYIPTEEKEISVPFIYYIIKHFFQNKDLVDEYFSSII